MLDQLLAILESKQWQVGGEQILAASDTISFHFKTRKSSGLLYFNGKPPVSLCKSI